MAQPFLPSSYPQDPEVFASDGAELRRAASFGQEFRPVGIVTGLPALSASFATDRTAFVVNSQGVWRQSLEGSTPSLAIASPEGA